MDEKFETSLVFSLLVGIDSSIISNFFHSYVDFKIVPLEQPQGIMKMKITFTSNL